MPLDAYLFCEKHVADLLPRSANIGPPAHHEFIADDAECKIIDPVGVVLSTHNLWRHVARSAWSVRGVILLKNSRYAHVCDSEVAVVLHNNILGLYVSVNHVFVVHVLETNHHAGDHEFGLGLIKSLPLANVEAQIASIQQVHHHVQILMVLKRKIHIYQEPKRRKNSIEITDVLAEPGACVR